MTDQERNAVIEECAAFIDERVALLAKASVPNAIQGAFRDQNVDLIRTLALAMRGQMKR